MKIEWLKEKKSFNYLPTELAQTNSHNGKKKTPTFYSTMFFLVFVFFIFFIYIYLFVKVGSQFMDKKV